MLQMREQAALEQGIDTTQINRSAGSWARCLHLGTRHDPGEHEYFRLRRDGRQRQLTWAAKQPPIQPAHIRRHS